MQSQITFKTQKRSSDKLLGYAKKIKSGDNNDIHRRNYSAFLTSNKFSVCERTTEIQKVFDFIENHCELRKPGSLYISGSPGTGKTMTIRYILSQINSNQIKQTFINCMGMSSAMQIFTSLLVTMDTKGRMNLKSKNIQDTFVKMFVPSSQKMHLIVLDELDQLKTKDYDVLLKVFGSPSMNNSNVIIIGISNTLDLIEQLLPKMKYMAITPPQIFKFLPYTDQQILNILHKRFIEANVSNEDVLFEPSALEYCSRKVSALNGDMRIALDACRKALEFLGKEQYTDSTLPHTSILSDTTNNYINIKNDKLVKRVKITMSELSRVLPDFDNQLVHQIKHSLSINQKIVLATLIQYMKCNNAGNIVMNKAYENYVVVCKKHKLSKIPYTDFSNACDLLQDHKIIHITTLYHGLTKKIQIKHAIALVEKGLQDSDGLLSSIINKVK